MDLYKRIHAYVIGVKSGVSFYIAGLFIVATLLSCLGQIIEEKIALFIDVWKCHDFIEKGLIYVNNDTNVTYSAQGISYKLCE